MLFTPLLASDAENTNAVVSGVKAATAQTEDNDASDSSASAKDASVSAEDKAQPEPSAPDVSKVPTESNKEEQNSSSQESSSQTVSKNDDAEATVDETEVTTSDQTNPEPELQLMAGTLREGIASADGHAYTVSVTFGEDAVIPQGAELVVKELNEAPSNAKDPAYRNRPTASEELVDKKVLAEHIARLSKELGVHSGKDRVMFAKLISISLQVNGAEVVPQAPVTITVSTNAVEEAGSDAVEMALRNNRNVQALAVNNLTEAGKGTTVSATTSQLGELGLFEVARAKLLWETHDEQVSILGAGSLAVKTVPASVSGTVAGLQLLAAFGVQVQDLPAYGTNLWLEVQPASDFASKQGEQRGVVGYRVDDGTLGAVLSGIEGTEAPVAIEPGERIALLWDTGLRDASVDLGDVTVSGLMPINSNVAAEDVAADFADPTHLAGIDAAEGEDVTTVAAYDLSVRTDEGDYEPENKPLSVTIATNGADDANLEVWRVGDNGAAEVVDATLVDGIATFETTDIGTYLVTERVVLERELVASDGRTYDVTVSFGPDAKIPNGAALEVRELAGTELDVYGEQTAEALGDELAYLRAFDITLVDAKGRAVEPQATVDVSIRLADDDASERARVLHFADDADAPSVLPAQTEDTANGVELTFATDSFSVYAVAYTVDFHWQVDGKTYDYSMEGEGSLLLSELFAQLEIDVPVAEVTNVTFSNPELLLVEAVEDDWKLTSLAPFNSDETLTVYLSDGESFSIRVTDAQARAGTIKNPKVSIKTAGVTTEYQSNLNFTTYADGTAVATAKAVTTKGTHYYVPNTVTDTYGYTYQVIGTTFAPGVISGNYLIFDDDLVLNMLEATPLEYLAEVVDQFPTANESDVAGFARGDKNDTSTYELFKQARYNDGENTITIILKYFQKMKRNVPLDFIFTLDDSGTMGSIAYNKNTRPFTMPDGTTKAAGAVSFRATQSVWCRVVLQSVLQVLMEWEGTSKAPDADANGLSAEQKGYNIRVAPIAFSSAAVSGTYQSTYQDAKEEISRIYTSGGTDHSKTVAAVKALAQTSINGSRYPIVVYLSDFHSNANSAACKRAMTDFRTLKNKDGEQVPVYTVHMFEPDFRYDRNIASSTDNMYLVKDTEPIGNLLGVFQTITKDAIGYYVGKNISVQDGISPQIAKVAESYTVEGDGQMAQSGSTFGWSFIGTDTNGNEVRLPAGVLYTRTITIKLKDDVVLSPSVLSNSKAEVQKTVEDDNGNVSVVSPAPNSISEQPKPKTNVTFWLGLLDENDAETTAQLVNTGGFELHKDSQDGTRLWGPTNTNANGNFTISQSDTIPFNEGDVYYLVQTSTNTNVAISEPPLAWKLTVKDGTIVSEKVGNAPQSSVRRGVLCLWNQAKVDNSAPLVPVVITKTWGEAPTATSKVGFTVLGNNGDDPIELPAYNGPDRTASGFEEVTELTAQTKDDSGTAFGTKTTWTKTLYVPAYSGGRNDNDASRVWFFNLAKGDYSDIGTTNGTKKANGYTIREDSVNGAAIEGGSNSVETDAGTWTVTPDVSTSTSSQKYTYYTYNGISSSQEVEEVTTDRVVYYRFDFEKRSTSAPYGQVVYSVGIDFDYVDGSGSNGTAHVEAEIDNEKNYKLTVAEHHVYGILLPADWGSFSNFRNIQINGTTQDSSEYKNISLTRGNGYVNHAYSAHNWNILSTSEILHVNGSTLQHRLFASRTNLTNEAVKYYHLHFYRTAANKTSDTAEEITLTISYTEGGVEKTGRIKLKLSERKNIQNEVYVVGVSLPSEWQITNQSITKFAIDGSDKEFTTGAAATGKEFYYVRLASVTYSYYNGSDWIETSGIWNTTNDGLGEKLEIITEATREEHTTTNNLTTTSLSLSNAFKPSYNLEVGSTFADNSRDSASTGNIKSVTYVITKDGADYNTLTVDVGATQTLKVPAGTYTVTQTAYTLNNDKVVSATNGAFAAYNVDAPTKSATFADAGGATQTLIFANTRKELDAKVRVEWPSVEEYGAIQFTDSITYDFSYTVYQNDKIKKDSASGSLQGDAQGQGWETSHEHVPTYGIDGSEATLALTLPDNSPLYEKYDTEITRDVDANTIVYTIANTLKSGIITINKVWVLDSMPANEEEPSKVSVTVSSTDGKIVRNDVELTAQRGWSTQVRVPVGKDYTVTETAIGNTAIKDVNDYVTSYSAYWNETQRDASTPITLSNLQDAGADVTITNVCVICKVVDTDGTANAFATLREALAYARSKNYTTSAAGATIYLLTDYTMPANDSLSGDFIVKENENLTLTTAGKDDATYPYRGEGSVATITRGFTPANAEDTNNNQLFTVNGYRAILTLANITIDGNKANYSGGKGSLVYVNGTGGGTNVPALVIGAGATLQNAKSSGSTGGGAVYVTHGTVTVDAGGSIQNCEADKCNGGAIYAESTGAVVNIKGSLTGNSAVDGGAIKASKDVLIYIYEGASLTGNSANKNGEKNGVGGAIYTSGTVNVYGGSITGNTADYKGAGVYADGDGSVYFSGEPVVYDNKVSGKQRNVEFSGNNNTSINLTSALGDGAKIGVYAPNGHKDGGEAFGTRGSITDNLYKFVNDRDNILYGVKVGDDGLIYWPYYVARVSNDDGATWTYHEYLISAETDTQNGNSILKGAFNQANGLTGNVIIETLRETAEINGQDRYTMKKGYAFTNTPSKTNVTLRTTQDDKWNPLAGEEGSQKRFTSTITRGFEDIDSMLTAGNGVTFNVASIVLDGANKHDTSRETDDTMDGDTVTAPGNYQRGGILHVEAGGALNVNDGVTLQNGKAARGGAIYGRDETTININGGVQIKDCVATTYGGGIYTDGTLNINGTSEKKVTITNCSAADGGGIRTSEAQNSVTISWCEISDCEAKGASVPAGKETIPGSGGKTAITASGGGIFAWTKALTMTDSAVTGCTAGWTGGGMTSSGTIKVTRSNISNNTSGGLGGGIYALSGAKLHLTNTGSDPNGSHVNGNAAQSGGGIYHEGGSGAEVKLENAVTVNDNRAESTLVDYGRGGGVYVGAGTALSMVASEVSRTDDGVTRSATNGGGIYAVNSTVTLDGSAKVEGNVVSTDDTLNNIPLGSGGAIFMDGGTLNLHGDTHVTNNQAKKGSGTQNNDYKGCGGAIYLANSATMTMYAAGVLLQGNAAEQDGGAIYSSTNSTVNVDNGSIGGADTASANTAGRNGGGVYLVQSTATVKGGTISGNAATNNGGGVYVANLAASFDMQGGTISKNTANYGGGVCLGNSDSKFTMSGGTIGGSDAGNTAKRGAGIYVASGSSTTELKGGAVSHNQTNGDKLGGGLFVDNATVTIAGTNVTNNAAGQGGGVYAYNGANVKLVSGSISNNSVQSGSHGGGVYVANNSVFTMQGGSMEGNSAKDNGSAVFLQQDRGNGKTAGVFHMSGGSITNNTVSDTCGAVETGDANGRINLSGNPEIYDNKNGDQQKNIVLSQDSNEVIQVTGTLEATDKKIGIYVTDGSTLYDKHGKVAMPFGTYGENSNSDPKVVFNANMARFRNDRNPELFGMVHDKGDDSEDLDYQIYWGKYICKIVDKTNTPQEHLFPSLHDAMKWLRDNAGDMGLMDGSIKKATIEMLVDYDIPANDFLVDRAGATNHYAIAESEDITLTTAHGGNYKYSNDTTNATITRGAADASLLVSRGNLTLINITLDGNKSSYVAHANGGLVSAVKGTLTLDNGAILQNSRNEGNAPALVNDRQEQGTYGGAVYVGGSIAIKNENGEVTGYEDAAASLIIKQGAVIKNNEAYAATPNDQVQASANGGGIFVRAGSSIKMTGGEISNNIVEVGRGHDQTASAKGAGLYVAGIVTELSGGSIKNNVAKASGEKADKANYDGGGMLVASTQPISVGAITISGNEANNGGGIYVSSGGNVTVMDGANISENTAKGYGGGMYAASGTTLKITGGTVSENHAKRGGGVYTASANAEISGGTISNNSIPTDGVGGGGIWAAANLTIKGSAVVRENKAEGKQGGGIYAAAALSVTDTVSITGNMAQDGGGVYTNSSGSLNMTGGSISANKATAKGSAVYVNGDSMTMSGGEISGNTVSATVGAVQVGNENARLYFSGNAKVTGNTFGSGESSNVYLDFDTNKIINAKDLSMEAQIGVRVSEAQFAQHGEADMRFGSYEYTSSGENVTESLSRFVNDVRGYTGVKANATEIKWDKVPVPTVRFDITKAWVNTPDEEKKDITLVFTATKGGTTYTLPVYTGEDNTISEELTGDQIKITADDGWKRTLYAPLAVGNVTFTEEDITITEAELPAPTGGSWVNTENNVTIVHSHTDTITPEKDSEGYTVERVDSTVKTGYWLYFVAKSSATVTDFDIYFTVKDDPEKGQNTKYKAHYAFSSPKFFKGTEGRSCFVKWPIIGSDKFTIDKVLFNGSQIETEVTRVYPKNDPPYNSAKYSEYTLKANPPKTQTTTVNVPAKVTVTNEFQGLQLTPLIVRKTWATEVADAQKNANSEIPFTVYGVYTDTDGKEQRQKLTAYAENSTSTAKVEKLLNTDSCTVNGSEVAFAKTVYVPVISPTGSRFVRYEIDEGTLTVVDDAGIWHMEPTVTTGKNEWTEISTETYTGYLRLNALADRGEYENVDQVTLYFKDSNGEIYRSTAKFSVPQNLNTRGEYYYIKVCVPKFVDNSAAVFLEGPGHAYYTDDVLTQNNTYYGILTHNTSGTIGAPRFCKDLATDDRVGVTPMFDKVELLKSVPTGASALETTGRNLEVLTPTTLSMKNTLVICKIEDGDGVEHIFPTLHAAMDWARTNMKKGGSGTDKDNVVATIQMLVDYTMPNTDALAGDYAIGANGRVEDITITTAATSGGKFNFKASASRSEADKADDLKDKAIIRRGFGTEQNGECLLALNNGTSALTVTNLILDGNKDSYVRKGDGGLIWADGTLNITTGAVLRNAKTPDRGGAVQMQKGTLNISGDARFLNSEAAHGGAIHIGNDAVTTTIEGTVLIDGNKATGYSGNDGYGGGVFVRSKNTTIRGSVTIRNNEATSHGGGVNVGWGGAASLAGGNVQITGCSAPYGGGINVEGTQTGYDKCTLSMGVGVTVSGNTATLHGGGVFVDNTAEFTLTGGTITGNASASGGAIDFGGADARLYLEGNALVYDNKDASGNQKNVVLAHDTNDIIRTTSNGLDAAAHVGVYVVGEDNSEAEQLSNYNLHGVANAPFGTFAEGLSADGQKTLAHFTNDRNGLSGTSYQRDGGGYLVYWEDGAAYLKLWNQTSKKTLYFKLTVDDGNYTMPLQKRGSDEQSPIKVKKDTTYYVIKVDQKKNSSASEVLYLPNAHDLPIKVELYLDENLNQRVESLESQNMRTEADGNKASLEFDQDKRGFSTTLESGPRYKVRDNKDETPATYNYTPKKLAEGKYDKDDAANCYNTAIASDKYTLIYLVDSALEVGFTKIDGHGKLLKGAGFALYSTPDAMEEDNKEGIQAADDTDSSEVKDNVVFSTETGVVKFKAPMGVHFMSETETPSEGDYADVATYVLLVGEEYMHAENLSGIQDVDLSAVTQAALDAQNGANASGISKCYAIFPLDEDNKAVVDPRGADVVNYGLMNAFGSGRKVILSKAASDDASERLGGAKFEVYNSDWTYRGGTDASKAGTGLALVEDLPYGTYYLKETETPDGYGKEGAYFQLEVTEDGTKVTYKSDSMYEPFAEADVKHKRVVETAGLGGSSVTPSGNVIIEPASGPYKVDDRIQLGLVVDGEVVSTSMYDGVFTVTATNGEVQYYMNRDGIRLMTSGTVTLTIEQTGDIWNGEKQIPKGAKGSITIQVVKKDSNRQTVDTTIDGITVPLTIGHVTQDAYFTEQDLDAIVTDGGLVKGWFYPVGDDLYFCYKATDARNEIQYNSGFFLFKLSDFTYSDGTITYSGTVIDGSTRTFNAGKGSVVSQDGHFYLAYSDNNVYQNVVCDAEGDRLYRLY